MLNYAEFKEQLLTELRIIFAEIMPGAVIEEHSTTKVNATVEGFMVKSPEHNFAPTLYFGAAYTSYKMGGRIHEIATIMAQQVTEAFDKSKVDYNVMGILDHAKGHIIPQLINTEKNKEYLETVAHREFLDLSIIYRIVVTAVDGSLGSVVVTNEILGYIHMTEEELYEDALSNGHNILKPMIRDLVDVAQAGIEKGYDSDDPISPDFLPGVKGSMYIVSNQTGMQGAATILYKDVLEGVANQLESDLLIIPSSVQECIALSADSVFADGLKDMVYDVKFTQLDEEERLSNSLYKYVRETGQIEFVYQSDKEI